MLGYIGSSRPTIEEIKEHPWIKDKIDSNQSEYMRQIIMDVHGKGAEAKDWLKCYKEQIATIE